MRKLAAIILAAGKGSRMQAKQANKVTFFLANKPLILHSIHTLEEMRFDTVIVVIGFAKESVKNALRDSKVIFAEQKRRLGTAHAVKSALRVLPSDITDVLIIQGDDSAFYKKNIISKLKTTHFETQAALTFLTLQVTNPQGLGRIVRDEYGRVEAVVEEKDATPRQRKIIEINPACYVFNVKFLKKYLPKVQKSPVTGEYYLTSLIDIAIKNNEITETVQAGFMPWRGVNTREELAEAERMYQSLKD